MAKTEKGADGGVRKGDVRSGTVSGKEAKAVYDQLDKIHDAMDADNSGHMSDINTIYDNASDRMGIRKRVLIFEYKEYRHELKRKRKIENMDAAERQERDDLATAIGAFIETELGGAAAKAEAAGAAATGVH